MDSPKFSWLVAMFFLRIPGKTWKRRSPLNRSTLQQSNMAVENYHVSIGDSSSIVISVFKGVNTGIIVSFPRTMVILFCMVHIPNLRIDENLEMTSFTERGTRPLCKKTHLQELFTHHSVSCDLPTTDDQGGSQSGRVGLGENSQVQLTSGVTLQPGDFIKAAEPGAVLVSRKDRPLIWIDVFYSFHNQGIYVISFHYMEVICV